MSATNKAKHAAQGAKGKAKEAAGRVAGSDRLQSEGRADQAAARMKHAADKAADAAKHAIQDAKGKAKEAAGSSVGDDRLKAEGEADQASAHIKKNLNK